MKRKPTALLSIFLASLIALVGVAQTKQTPTKKPAAPAKPDAVVKPTEKPFLWIVESKKTHKPSFILGTIHVPDPRATTLPDVTQAAFNASDEVYTEIPLDAQTQVTAQGRLFRTDGKSLQDSIGEKLYGDLTKYVESKDGQMLLFDNMKTGFVPMALGLLDLAKMPHATSEPLDAQIYGMATQAGKTTGALETVDEQVGIIDSVSESDGAKMIGKALQDMKRWDSDHPKQSMTEHMVDLYHKGDGQKLYELSQQYFDPNEAFSKQLNDKLVTKRDENMANRMSQHMSEHPDTSHFFAIGAMHLLTKGTSVVDRLQKAGYTLRRLTPADTATIAKLKSADGGEEPAAADSNTKSNTRSKSKK